MNAKIIFNAPLAASTDPVTGNKMNRPDDLLSHLLDQSVVLKLWSSRHSSSLPYSKAVRDGPAAA